MKRPKSEPVRRLGRRVRPKHLDTLLENLGEVNRLLEIHAAIAGAAPGRKHKVEVLNKSGIVLLVAALEAYVEDLAEISFELLLRKATSPNVFPTKVLVAASKDAKESKDERKVWELAGDGWKEVMKRHQKDIRKRFIGKLNTPKPEQIDELFASLLGVTRVTTKWSWPKMTPAKARRRLERLVELRGSIAHRVAASESVLKVDVLRYAKFVGNIAAQTHLAVGAQLERQLGFEPWT